MTVYCRYNFSNKRTYRHLHTQNIVLHMVASNTISCTLIAAVMFTSSPQWLLYKGLTVLLTNAFAVNLFVLVL
jgi:hypothetical protein